VKCRPVGQSMLVSYSGDLIAGGGELAGVCLPAGDWEKNLTGNATGQNQIKLFDAMSDFPKSSTQKLANGLYVWWKPSSIEDMKLRNVLHGHSTETMKDYDYPLLVCSGHINNQAASSMLVTIFTNYNYSTNTRDRSGMDCDDCPEAISLAMYLMKDLPTSMPNGDHIDWIKTILGGVLGFVAGGPVGAAFGAAAGAGLSLFGIQSKKTT